jgi:hypothetical protein
MLRDRKKWQQYKHRGHHQKLLEQHLFLLSLDNLAAVLGFLTLQDKHNILTLLENIKLICTPCKKKRTRKPTKDWLFNMFLDLIQINFIFSDHIHVRIFPMYIQCILF